VYVLAWNLVEALEKQVLSQTFDLVAVLAQDLEDLRAEASKMPRAGSVIDCIPANNTG